MISFANSLQMSDILHKRMLIQLHGAGRSSRQAWPAVKLTVHWAIKNKCGSGGGELVAPISEWHEDIRKLESNFIDQNSCIMQQIAVS